jgi:dCTP deaminase
MSAKMKTAEQYAEAMPGLLADSQIRDLALNHGMIDPFVEKQTRAGVISYGLSSYGYDARCSPRI